MLAMEDVVYVCVHVRVRGGGEGVRMHVSKMLMQLLTALIVFDCECFSITLPLE